MRWLLILIISLLWLMSYGYSIAKLRVVATLRWIGYVVERVGGDRVEVRTLVNPKVDPHRLLPRPSYVRYLRRAHLLVYNGLFLESGYLPKLVEISRNPHIVPGSEGDLDCSKYIPLVLEKVEHPERVVVRADLHPFGNPHYQYYPPNVIAVAKAVAERLSELDPPGRDYYMRNYQSFKRDLEERDEEWRRALEPLRGVEVVEYHKSFEYLAYYAGMRIIGTLEPVPGVPPSASHVQEIIELIKERKPLALLTNVYYETRTPERIKELTGLPYVVLPHDLGSMEGTDTYEAMMDLVVKKLLEVAEGKGDVRR